MLALFRVSLSQLGEPSQATKQIFASLASLSILSVGIDSMLHLKLVQNATYTMQGIIVQWLPLLHEYYHQMHGGQATSSMRSLLL